MAIFGETPFSEVAFSELGSTAAVESLFQQLLNKTTAKRVFLIELESRQLGGSTS